MLSLPSVHQWRNQSSLTCEWSWCFLEPGLHVQLSLCVSVVPPRRIGAGECGGTIIYTSPPAGNSHARHKAGRQRKESRHRCCFSQQSPTHHTALHCIRGRNQGISIAAHNHLPPSRHSAKKSAFSTKAALGQLRSNQN